VERIIPHNRRNRYVWVLRGNPQFLRLWLASVVSLLGDWFGTIVLSALVFEFSGRSGLALSTFILTRIIPPIFISPIAGVLIDRYNRKFLLIFSDIARSIIVLGLLFAEEPSDLWLVYLLSAAQFTVAGLFEPCRNAWLPSVVRRRHLVEANTISSITWSVMLAVGALLGGLVAAAFGTKIALVIDAGTFAISALLIISIGKPMYAAKQAERSFHQTQGKLASRSFVAGLKYLREHPITAWILYVKFATHFASIETILLIYGTKLFAIGDDTTTPLSIFWSAFGIGAVIGPIVANRLFNDGSIQRMRRLILFGFAIVTLGLTIVSFANSIPLVAFAILFRAIGGSINWTYSSVIIQQSVEDSFLGRIFSLDWIGSFSATAISTIAIGAMVDYFGDAEIRTVVLLFAFFSLIGTSIWWWALRWQERYELQVKSVAAAVR